MSQRTERVGELIHQEISALLIKGLKDPRIGFMTISAVDVSPDLRLARVYYTVIGDETAHRETAAGLKSSASYIRQHLSRCLSLKYVPELVFLFDESIEYGQRIESILRGIQPESEDD